MLVLAYSSKGSRDSSQNKDDWFSLMAGDASGKAGNGKEMLISMTGLKFLNTSVVVLAEHHNPTILHPFFLEANSIVPKEWQQTPDSPVCSPPFAMVKYTNGITFTVEGLEANKFQVTDNAPPSSINNSLVPMLADRYMQVLPHVRYTAVGVNFHSFVPVEVPETLIVKRFIASGPWNDEDRLLQSAGLRFAYSVESGVLRLSLDSGTLTKEANTEPQRGIVINGNYHTDLTAEDRVKEISRILGLYGERCKHFISTVEAILGN